MPELTRDTMYNGRLTLFQPQSGYRFSVDAPLLADFVQAGPGRTVVDLGTGVGIIALTLARRMGQGRVLAVEVQRRLAECAEMNVAKNPGGARVEVLNMDWSGLNLEVLGGPADIVVCNPPYRRLGTGRISPDQEEAVARHEIRGSLVSAAQTAVRVLTPGGSLAVIYPASRLAGLMAGLRAAGLEPKRLRLVHSRPGEKAVLVLVEARAGGGEELEAAPPLYIYHLGEDYSAETQAILSGKCLDEKEERPGSF